RARAGDDEGRARRVSVRWGLLSTAPINLKLLAAAEQSDRAEVVAVGSRDAARAESYAREHGRAGAPGSYDALLADEEVDAVYVSPPNGLHIDWTMRALEAGKHVLCEKPMSRRADEVERALDLAEARGLVLSEGFMWRHHPQTERLVELIRGGAVGPLRLIRAAFSFPLAIERSPRDARFDPELDGGAMMDVGCYCVSAIRLFGGEPESVAGEQYVGPTGVDVVFAGTLGQADGGVSPFDCGLVCGGGGERGGGGVALRLRFLGSGGCGARADRRGGEPLRHQAVRHHRA